MFLKIKADIYKWNKKLCKASEVEMDKEIIIDGVDVAECIQFVEDDNCCCDLGGDCKGWDNCYYKQLKRAEQENYGLNQELLGYKKGVQASEIIELKQTLQEIKAIAEPFAKCYTHTCRNCEKYDSAHACCLKDIHCYKYNDGSISSCKDFVLPTKQFYQQILANVITKITKAEEK